MISQTFRISLTLLMALFLNGCISTLFGINLTAVGEKTALERQVLGTYEEIGRDLIVYASVRGVEPDGSMKTPPEVTDSQQQVVQALNNRRYNRDDLDVILLSGIAGEGSDAMLVIQNEQAISESPLGADLVRQVIAEENEDRRVVLRRLMETTPGVSESDAAEVAWIFATLNQDLAPVGASVQSRDGGWRVK